MEIKITLEIERTAYEEFLRLVGSGKFQHQRLGQAFYNHFRLHHLRDQLMLQGLYESDGKKALGMITDIFDIR